MASSLETKITTIPEKSNYVTKLKSEKSIKREAEAVIDVNEQPFKRQRLMKTCVKKDEIGE